MEFRKDEFRVAASLGGITSTDETQNESALCLLRALLLSPFGSFAVLFRGWFCLCVYERRIAGRTGKYWRLCSLSRAFVCVKLKSGRGVGDGAGNVPARLRFCVHFTKMLRATTMEADGGFDRESSFRIANYSNRRQRARAREVGVRPELASGFGFKLSHPAHQK